MVSLLLVCHTTPCDKDITRPVLLIKYYKLPSAKTTIRASVIEISSVPFNQSEWRIQHGVRKCSAATRI